MRKPKLAEDYIRRAHVRLKALDALYEAGSWADVVRESQELVELAFERITSDGGHRRAPHPRSQPDFAR